MAAESVATRPVVVVLGAGEMGLAIADRLIRGTNKHLVLADNSTETLSAAHSSLASKGYDSIHAHQLDVTSSDSLQSLISTATALGPVETVVHTAGLAPATNSAASIYAVNLVGTNLVINAFRDVIAPRGSLTITASIGGHSMPIALHDQAKYALNEFSKDSFSSAPDNPSLAYAVTKAANIYRVKAAAKAYGERGVRINTVSPGVTDTGMGKAELEGPSGAHIKMMIETNPLPRLGTVEDIAEAVGFLADGEKAAYITGTDLVVDGGSLAEGARKQYVENVKVAAAGASG